MLSRRGAAVLARAQHVAGNDEPLTGADRRARERASATKTSCCASCRWPRWSKGRCNERERDESIGRIAALRSLCWLLGVAALSRLAQQPKFQLKRIDVRGDLHHVTASSVRTALAGRLRGNYFTMRLDDTRRLFETVPWVAQASVRRVWPDRLLVTLIRTSGARACGKTGACSPIAASFSLPIPTRRRSTANCQSSADQPAQRKTRLGAITNCQRNLRHCLCILLRSTFLIARPGRCAWSLSRVKTQNNPTRCTLSSVGIGLRYRSASAWRSSSLRTHWWSRSLAVPPARIDARYANGLAASSPAKMR